MGDRNTQFTGHISDTEADQQGHSQPHPEPCIFYRTTVNFPQPNIPSVVPSPGHRIPEHHDSTLFYGMQQLSGVQPHPAINSDLAVGAPSGHYNPYLAAPSGIRDFRLQVNHGAYDQLSLSSTQRIVGIPTDSYGRNIHYMDTSGGSFKRKNAEGTPGNYQSHNASAGPSSSIAPVTAMPADPEITLMDATSFTPPEYVPTDPTPIVESGSQRIVTNRPGLVGPESVVAHNGSHLFRGNYVAPTVQLPGNPWLDVHFGANNGDIGTFTWTHSLPYVPASVSGASVEAGNIGVQGYQVTASNRSSGSLLHPPLPQSHPHPHHLPLPMQWVRGYNVNPPSQAATSSRRISTISSSNTSISPFHDVVDAGPTYPPSGPPMGFRFYRPQPREITIDSSSRHHILPHLRVLPEDGLAMLEIPGYHQTGSSIDQHRDMRLDIDHMSYEELLALGEQIGSVGTGLSEECILNNLKIRTFTTSAACFNLEEPPCLDQQINFCVICQTEYENAEDIVGTLDCGHEYHRDCIKKWLLVKNTCPVCKSTALSRKSKDL